MLDISFEKKDNTLKTQHYDGIHETKFIPLTGCGGHLAKLLICNRNFFIIG